MVEKEKRSKKAKSLGLLLLGGAAVAAFALSGKKAAAQPTCPEGEEYDPNTGTCTSVLEFSEEQVVEDTSSGSSIMGDVGIAKNFLISFKIKNKSSTKSVTLNDLFADVVDSSGSVIKSEKVLVTLAPLEQKLITISLNAKDISSAEGTFTIKLRSALPKIEKTFSDVIRIKAPLCPSGTQLDFNTGICNPIICPPGTRLNPSNNQCEVIICPPGTQLNPATNQCELIQCPPGKKINLQTGQCEDILCPPGNQLNLSNNQCEPIICPTGTRLNLNTNQCDPIICSPGTKLNPTTNECEQIVCPPGFRLNLSTNSCEPIICPSDKILDLNTNTCVCAPDKEVNPSGTCVDKCPPGKIRDQNFGCVCPPGQVENPITGICEPIQPSNLQLSNLDFTPREFVEKGDVIILGKAQNISSNSGGTFSIKVSIQEKTSGLEIAQQSFNDFFAPLQSRDYVLTLRNVTRLSGKDEYDIKWFINGNLVFTLSPSLIIRKQLLPARIEITNIGFLDASVVEGQTVRTQLSIKNISPDLAGTFTIHYKIVGTDGSVVLDVAPFDQHFDPNQIINFDPSFASIGRTTGIDNYYFEVNGIKSSTTIRIDPVPKLKVTNLLLNPGPQIPVGGRLIVDTFLQNTSEQNSKTFDIRHEIVSRDGSGTGRVISTQRTFGPAEFGSLRTTFDNLQKMGSNADHILRIYSDNELIKDVAIRIFVNPTLNVVTFNQNGGDFDILIGELITSSVTVNNPSPDSGVFGTMTMDLVCTEDGSVAATASDNVGIFGADFQFSKTFDTSKVQDPNINITKTYKIFVRVPAAGFTYEIPGIYTVRPNTVNAARVVSRGLSPSSPQICTAFSIMGCGGSVSVDLFNDSSPGPGTDTIYLRTKLVARANGLTWIGSTSACSFGVCSALSTSLPRGSRQVVNLMIPKTYLRQRSELGGFTVSLWGDIYVEASFDPSFAKLAASTYVGSGTFQGI